RAQAGGRRPARASAGAAPATENEGPSPRRSAIASARPEKPAPPISTSMGCGACGIEDDIGLRPRSCHGRFADGPGCGKNGLPMFTAIQDLLNVLDLEQLEVNLFRGHTPPTGRNRVYGGHGHGPSAVAPG